MKPLQDPGLSSEDVQNAVKTKSQVNSLDILAEWQLFRVRTNSDLYSRLLSQCIDLKNPGESTDRPLLPPAGFLPERVVNVQINVQPVDEELPVSWVNTNSLAEMLKGQAQGVRWMPKPLKWVIFKVLTRKAETWLQQVEDKVCTALGRKLSLKCPHWCCHRIYFTYRLDSHSLKIKLVQ